MRIFIGVVIGLAVAGAVALADKSVNQPGGDKAVRLGNFSISLLVKDIAASRTFYEKLGFHAMAGKQEQGWLIMQNEATTIGLHSRMLEKNSLTFNPGWDNKCNTLPDFDDVRDIQKRLKEQGITPSPAADEGSEGPAFFVVVDPDGNPILVDQHIPRPKK